MTERARGQWRWPLPDDWTPTGYWCVQLTIPADQQYFDRLTGALGLLTLPKSWYPDPTGAGPYAVAEAWEQALYLNMFVVSETCPVVPSPPIPNQAAADDAAAAIFTVFLQHIVAELNACAPTAGDCAGCVDSIMTELSPYGAQDAVRGALTRLCADLNADATGRASFETDCPYQPQFDDLRAKIADNPYDWLNHLSDWMFQWLNQTSNAIMQDLNTLAGLMGFGAQGFVNDNGGIPSGGGASFGGDCAWSKTWDFTATDGGWVSASSYDLDSVEYLAGVGFHSVWSHPPSGSWHLIGMGRACAGAHVTAIEVIGSATINGFAVAGPGYQIANGLHYEVILATAGSASGAFDYTWAGDTTISDGIAFFIGVGSAAEPTEPGGEATVTSITISGLGANPFA